MFFTFYLKTTAVYKRRSSRRLRRLRMTLLIMPWALDNFFILKNKKTGGINYGKRKND
jgi:hypothetical protein